MDALAVAVCIFAFIALSLLFTSIDGGGCLEKLAIGIIAVVVLALVLVCLVGAGIGG